MIDVLLATYRPQEAMLKAQVESIRAQTGVEVNLIRREDTEGLGACGNFSALLSESRAEYVAFSDQDDVWLGQAVQITCQDAGAGGTAWQRHSFACVLRRICD